MIAFVLRRLIQPVIVMIAVAFIANSVFTPKSSTGYDFGIRHAF